MAKPWKTIESVDTDEGVLELRQRDERDFLITVGGLVLMNSMATITGNEISTAPRNIMELQRRKSPRLSGEKMLVPIGKV